MAFPKKALGALNNLSTAFLVFVGFLLVFFTTSKMRQPVANDVPTGSNGSNVVYADAPYAQGAYK